MILSLTRKDRFWCDGSVIVENAIVPVFFRLQTTAKAAT